MNRDNSVIWYVISVSYTHLDVYKRQVPISEIPQYVKDAFIVTEDKKFYQHNGVDAEANIRAFLALIKNNGEITQGDVYNRQIQFGDKTTKVEVLRVEETYKKDEAKELYRYL